MADVAGSVVIEIGGNLAPFEAALAKANQMATTFDAQVTAKLSGSGLTAGLEKISAGIEQTNALLAKLTTAGSTAGTTMSRLAVATQPVTAALQQVTAASAATNAELGKIGSSAGTASFAAGTISAKDFAAALEATGGNLTKITPAMLGMAEAEGVVTSATLEAQAAFRGLTEAQIASYAAAQEGANFNRALNESFGLINTTTKSARESASVFREMAAAEGEVGTASRGAAAGLTAVGAAERETAGLGAGVTREFMVLGGEIARGNFSRIPGSLIVMNERLVSTGAGVLTLSNGLKALGAFASTIFNPFVLGFLGLSFGLDLAIRGFENFRGGMSDVNTVLENHKKLIDEITAAYPAAGDAAKAYEEQASKIPSVVAAADTKEAIEANKDLIQSYLTDISSRLTVTGNDFALFGSAGSEAFMKLGSEIKDGSVSVEDVASKLGELRIDPSLNKNAHEFASSLQDSANKAAELEIKLRGVGAAANVFAGSTTNRGDEGANIIANMVSAGNAAADALKRVQDSLGTSGMTSYAAAIAKINQQFDAAIVKAHASGAALDAFNQARNLSIQEESIKSLSGISFDAPIAGAKAFGETLGAVGNAAAGVKVELGGMAAPIVNISQLFGRAKLDQLIGLEQAGQKLQGFNAEIDDTRDKLSALQNYSVDKLFGAGSSGTAADISGAYNAIDEIFKRWDAGSMSVKDVYGAIEQVRASLVAMGGNVSSVNEFVNAIVNGEMRVRQLTGDVQNLSQSIRAIPNRTVIITIKTQRIGSGTQSLYDVPNGSGGTSSVGVTRYGGASDQSITANTVPNYDGSGTSTVNVTRYGSGTPYTGGYQLGGISTTGANAGKQIMYIPPGMTEAQMPSTYTYDYQPTPGFATGGMIHPGDSQRVSFFKSPDETVGIFTPAQMQALADPQSGFNGTQPTANDNRAWTVLMNIEANTQKTAQLLDEIKTSTASTSSAMGGSSYSGGGSSGNSDPLAAAYAQALQTAKTNFQAAGVYIGAPLGYGLNGLQATPEQIARRAVYGMATGGMIGGDAGDTQKVEFFKNPNEKVIIARPDQFNDVRSSAANSNSSGAERPIVLNLTQHHNWNGNAPPSRDSLAELQRQTALAVRSAMRSVNGRG